MIKHLFVERKMYLCMPNFRAQLPKRCLGIGKTHGFNDFCTIPQICFEEKFSMCCFLYFLKIIKAVTYHLIVDDLEVDCFCYICKNYALSYTFE